MRHHLTLQNSPEVCLFNKNVSSPHQITSHHIWLYLPNQTGAHLSELVIGTIIVSRSEFHSLLDERRSLLRKRNKIWGWNINVRGISVWPHSRRWRIGNIACWSTGWILAKFGSETLIYNRTLIFVFQAGQAGRQAWFLYLQSPVTSWTITITRIVRSWGN